MSPPAMNRQPHSRNLQNALYAGCDELLCGGCFCVRICLRETTGWRYRGARNEVTATSLRRTPRTALVRSRGVLIRPLDRGRGGTAPHCMYEGWLPTLQMRHRCRGAAVPPPSRVRLRLLWRHSELHVVHRLLDLRALETARLLPRTRVDGAHLQGATAHYPGPPPHHGTGPQGCLGQARSGLTRDAVAVPPHTHALQP